MCGIVGKISRNKELNPKSIEELSNLISKRGPDESGYFVKSLVEFGHRRLSIIDLSTGNQPLHSKDENCVIIFNGEIYNFINLRANLAELGYSFQTQSDTEVILASYQMHGIEKTLEVIEGMFAFAIYDIKKGKIYIARDKFGEKPLFYTHINDSFYFASELKALKPVLGEKKIDRTALNLFFAFSYIPAPYTIYENVKKLEAGKYLTIDTSASITSTTYYDLSKRYDTLTPITNYTAAKDELRELLFDSVKHRMIADVPLGAFLSGGIDSSIVSAIMAKHSPQPINTFSIGFREKQYDESERAALVAKHIKSNHTVKFLTHHDILGVVDEVLDYFDEPFADSSALPSHFVAKIAREHVKVALTGDAADELFGGYEKYLGPLYAKKFNSLPNFVQNIVSSSIASIPHTPFTNHFLRKANKVIGNASLSEFDLHYNLMCLGFNDSSRKTLMTNGNYQDLNTYVKTIYNALGTNDFMSKGFYSDMKISLEGDMLAKVDRMGMYNSLEARIPFLDTKVVEFAYRIPTSFKIQGNNKKRILKDTFKDLLPEKVFQFGKRGFGVPINMWFKNELKESLIALLSPDALKVHGLFDIPTVQRLMSDHFSNKRNNTTQLWSLFVFQKWYNKNLEI